MTVKKISYFRSNPSTKETITILDCGYHETLHGHYSAQKVVDHFVLHIIVSGKGTYQLREQTYHLQKNDCFVLFPHVPICYQSDSQDPWVYYWVGFDGRDALEIMQLCNITYQIPILHYESTIELANILKPLIDLNTASISDSYFALGQFYSLCSRLMQYNQNIKPLTRKEYYVSQAVSLIENSYFKNISVQNISDAVGLERTYLYRIFKEITGVTIQEYLTDLKLKRARYFITCSGKMEVSCSLDEDHITSALIGDERRKIWDIENRNSYRQLSLFDDMHLEEEKNSLLKDQLVKEAAGSAAFGQL